MCENYLYNEGEDKNINKFSILLKYTEFTWKKIYKEIEKDRTYYESISGSKSFTSNNEGLDWFKSCILLFITKK